MPPCTGYRRVTNGRVTNSGATIGKLRLPAEALPRLLPGLLSGFLAAVGLAAVGLAVALSSPPAFAHALPRSILASGSINGVVVNASNHNANVPDLALTLQAVDSGIAKNVATTDTDSLGRFTFTGLDTSGLTTYAVYTHYQGGTFATSAISFTSGASQQATLQVYDTSSSDSGIRVASTTLLFSNPSQARGLLSVGVLMTIDNASPSAYLASVGPANGLPTNLLRFYLPPDAQGLALGAGFSGLQVIQVATGFGVVATVPPGDSVYAFVYEVPYSGTSYTYQFKAEYQSENVVALLPPQLGIAPGNFTPKPEVQANGTTYKVLAIVSQDSNATVSFELTHLPLPGENPDIDFGQLVLLGIGLLLLLLGLAWLFLRRGALAVAFGWVPASLFTPARVKSRRQALRDAERKQLLQALVALDEKRAAGLIGPATYSRRRAEIRAELRPLLLPGPSKATLVVATGEVTGNRTAEPMGDQPPVETGSRT